jgi:WhiB family redox-sensing transcriptional regulator
VPELADRYHGDGSDPDTVYELLNPPDWHQRAACKTAPAEITWFPGRGEDVRPALEVCYWCPVKYECRQWALDQPSTLEGIWGGLTEIARRKIRRGARGSQQGSQTLRSSA